ncbi:MAG: glycerate kinase family protein, partial [Planctomycetota bacterium]
MRVLVAPDSFKESLDAASAARAMARGVLAAEPAAEIDECPVADGGEGTVDALVRATGGEVVRTPATGPLGTAMEAAWGLLGDGRTAVIEMAAAAGLPLVPPAERDPTRTTTFGVGELILAALDAGRSRIVVGLGGSATGDGGVGMAQALGVGFEGVPAPATGGDLPGIQDVDPTAADDRLADAELIGACDVVNPLTGPRGAARVFGPQKGATPEQVEALERGLLHLASVAPWANPEEPGAGAAGGLGYGLRALLGARLGRGIDIVLDAVGIGARLAAADLVLTGEGRLDAQSAEGKAIEGVLRAARAAGVPVIVLAGEVAPGAVEALGPGVVACRSIRERAESREQALRESAGLLEALARDALTESSP